MKEKIVEILAKEIRLSKEEIGKMIENPPEIEMGDYSFPCFLLAKTEKKSPLLIAEDLTQKLRKRLPKEISNVGFKSGYVNFFVDKKILANEILKEAMKKDFGKSNIGKSKKIVIDMSAPNIAKPFGVGHLRSTIIGESISKIAEFNGFKCVKINYLGDWGTQFGKLILGYKKWGNESKLKKDALSHLQEIYVKVNSDEGLDDEAREEFRKLENGDQENLKLWKEFKELSLKKFDEIYELLGIKFDVISGESNYNDKMGAIIKLLEKKKLLIDSDDAKIIDLKDKGLGVVLIQKKDGTSLYATRDIAAAIERYKKYKFDKLIYEVGSEQTLHFKQFFYVLELLGYEWAKECVHVSHGLYLDNDGKKFSTRKGKTVYMQDILNETIEKAEQNLSKREVLDKEDAAKRARVIALAAIKYGDLKNYRENNMIFDIDRFLQFEGDTGPYLLYSYARASSIIRKVKSQKKVNLLDLKNEEIKLLKKINDFPEIIKRAYESLAPNLVANYCFELCQLFNEFYHSCPVLGSEEEGFRLRLVDCFKGVLKTGLGLLGIDVLEEM